jgi:Protein of unknown function, DUF547
MMIINIKRILIAISIASIFQLCHAAPVKNLWPRWQPYDKSATKKIDNSIYQKFLDKYLIAKKNLNRVNYDKVTNKDRKKLITYLNQFSHINIASYNKSEQLAFWINLYNAMTIKVILDAWPVTSILDVNTSPGFFSRGPWDAKLIEVDGIKLSLNDIEHRIIRPIWNDSLTHYALNCASFSCPNLQATVYSGDMVYKMMIQAAKDYINNPRGGSKVNNTLVLSKIYYWYQADFGGSEKALFTHLKKYANKSTRKMLDSYNDIKYDYDWSLNGV